MLGRAQTNPNDTHALINRGERDIAAVKVINTEIADEFAHYDSE